MKAKPTVHNVLGKELSLITESTIYNFVVSVFQNCCPDYFWTIPASVKGHHPPICRTRGGLVHHVKLAVAFADQLLDSLGIDDSSPQYSQTIAGVLLHDMMKRGHTEDELDTWDEHRQANQNHGRFCADFLTGHYTIMPELEPVIAAVRLHMGRWTNDVTQVELAILEMDAVVRTVHLADYMASRALHQLLAERHTDETMRYLND